MRQLGISLVLLACLAATGCRDRASEEDCRAACRNSVELSFWSDFEEEHKLRQRRERVRREYEARGTRMLESALAEDGELYDTLEGCVTVCRRTPTPPEIVECQLEATSVSQLNRCVRQLRH
jgi:hypothetical protein